MPHHKKKAKNGQKRQKIIKQHRELTLKEDGQEYAQIVKVLGNGRAEALCFDGKTRLAHVRGKIIKREHVALEDIVLVSLRDFQDDKADIILKYSADEARQLKSLGEIPAMTNLHDDDAALGELVDEAFVVEEI